MLETRAIRLADTADSTRLAALDEAVSEGERAHAEQRWVDVGTANMRFHQAIGGLAGSPRVDELMRQLLAELRLAFHVMSRPREFHEPYLEFNRRITTLVLDGKLVEAEQALEEYFDRAEAQLSEAFTQIAR